MIGDIELTDSRLDLALSSSLTARSRDDMRDRADRDSGEVGDFLMGGNLLSHITAKIELFLHRRGRRDAETTQRKQI